MTPGPSSGDWPVAGTGQVPGPAATPTPWPEAGTGQAAAPSAGWTAGTGQQVPAPSGDWPVAGATGQAPAAPVDDWPVAGTGHGPVPAGDWAAGTGQPPAPAGGWAVGGGTGAEWQQPPTGTTASPVWPEAGTGHGAALPGQDPSGQSSWPGPDASPTPGQDPYSSYGGPGGTGLGGDPAGSHEPHPAPATTAPPEAATESTAYLPPQTGSVPTGTPADPAGGPAGEGADGAGPAWSPPTLGGATRIRDPQQARAEGRSPIIDPGPQSALLTAALGGLLAAAAAFGDLALLLPLVVLQGLTAAGWFRLNGMWPARQGIALAFLGALVADAAVLAVGQEHVAGAVIGTLGVWVLLTLVLQLRSHASPDERVYGLMASVTSAALAVLCTGYLAAEGSAASIGALAVAVAAVARALPLPAVPSVVASLGAAAGAGIVVGGFTGTGAGGGALLGLTAGACALVGLRVAAYDYPSKFVHMTAGVAMPLAAAAPAVHLIGRVVG
ncbi:hypothetical protein [Streptomyces sp. NPDC097619]|uniref:hypothetical protein n=1 Tax=Streptomyces sp. NPDC097619 TaxID=3157228 RepID=UPI00331F3B89